MKKLGSLFDDFSSLKNEYRNSLKESINNSGNCGENIDYNIRHTSPLNSAYHSNARRESNSLTFLDPPKTPFEKQLSPVFSALDTVFKQRRNEARIELEKCLSNNLYSIMELSANATQKEIVKAYRRLSLKYHPDKQDGNDEKFISIANAYKILSNPELKSIYDEHGMACVTSYMMTIL
jgi:hypothetical protein